ncbi:hypothetical protein [Nakamurella deserti]|uniref:hypothetical protein n=1 Tax=Nakamurella deserti TaxID=2164074 RepID=UPI000DBE2467|nr:hypothetical protein [Nakamurella deserti]
MPTPHSLGATVFGAGRYLVRTAGSMAADVASAAVRTGEVVGGLVSGTAATPGTVRLTVLILSDEHGVPLLHPAQLEPALARADAVLTDGAGVRVRHVGTHVITEPAPTTALNPRANKLLLLDEALGRTDFYHRQLKYVEDTGSVTDVVGRPITAIVVRDIAGRTTGCSLGISADWVVVQAGLFDTERPHEYDETVLVHELGHALNLPHHPSSDNLMYYSSSPPEHVRGTGLNAVQRAVINANRHVVPGVRR